MVKATRPRRIPTRLGLRCSRAAALNLLLTKIFGLVWERGQPADPRATFVTLELEGSVEIGCFVMPDGVIDITINAFVGADWTGVFSAYLSDRPVDDAQYGYWKKRCSIHRWERGKWELLISKQAVMRRSLADVMTNGLAPLCKESA